MKSFRELFEPLGIAALGAPPEGSEYATGLGRTAWTLMNLILDPQTPAAARIAAIRDAVDRCEGKALPSAGDGKSRMIEFQEHFRWDRVSNKEAAELGRLLRLVDPDAED